MTVKLLFEAQWFFRNVIYTEVLACQCECGTRESHTGAAEAESSGL